MQDRDYQIAKERVHRYEECTRVLDTVQEIENELEDWTDEIKITPEAIIFTGQRRYEWQEGGILTNAMKDAIKKYKAEMYQYRKEI